MIRVCTLHFGERVYFAESKRFGEDYCARHGYTWHILPAAHYTDDRDLRWSKVPGVIDILELPDTSHVFYIDADAIVTNRGMSLEPLVTMLGEQDILIGEDWPGHINTGVWLVKPSGLDILKFWEDAPAIDPTLCHRWPLDEAGFSEHVYPRYKERIAFKRRSELNLVNGFVHHQMIGTQEVKSQRLKVFRGL